MLIFREAETSKKKDCWLLKPFFLLAGKPQIAPDDVFYCSQRVYISPQGFSFRGSAPNPAGGSERPPHTPSSGAVAGVVLGGYWWSSDTHQNFRIFDHDPVACMYCYCLLWRSGEHRRSYRTKIWLLIAIQYSQGGGEIWGKIYSDCQEKFRTLANIYTPAILSKKYPRLHQHSVLSPRLDWQAYLIYGDDLS